MFGKQQQEELLRELDRLRQRVAELETENARGLRLDPVTGLLSAKAFRGRLAEEVARARRYRRALALVVVSLDEYAALELRHGFKAADELLRAVGQRLASGTRSHDLVGRIGQAEFGLLMPDTEAARAKPALERLLIGLEQIGEGPIRSVGASMGIASMARGMSAEGLLASARNACAEAQAGGGGHAILAPEQGTAPAQAAEGPQREAVEALGVTLLERDRYTGEHSEALIEISGAVARNLGLSATEIERVKSAALLHDIGKVAIPDEILHKAGPLNDAEWKLMREHPVIGERIVRVLPGLAPVARIIRHEHEHWDGSGYPDGLVGEEIPLGSRIILAADAYHAITSDRPYRVAREHRDAVDELSRCAGAQFDPKVIGALIGCLYGARQAGVISA